ncbi:MAG: hypothetical protein J7496_08570 [Novosphingobium sp.]|nr:hypothetical protein [Novosphingobium sp.]
MTVAQRSSADRMIALKGQAVTIAATVDGAYDPATGGVSGDAYSATGKAVILPMSAFKAASDSRVIAGDEQMYLSGLDSAGDALPEPPNAAVITLADGSKRTLIAVDTLRPAGLPILYDCVVRGNA